MSANNLEVSQTPADESLSFEEKLKVQEEVLAEKLSDMLIQFKLGTGVADLYVAEIFASSALVKARKLALEKEKDKSTKSE